MAMALGEEVLSVVTDIIENVRAIDGTSYPRGCQMPGGKPCPVGCTCGKHRGGAMPPPEVRRERIRGQHRGQQRVYRATHREQAVEATRAWRAANPEKVRAWTALNGKASSDKHKYGLTPETRAQMLAEQGGRCYLGGELLDLENPRTIHVDHDHSCCPGVRSCGKCIRGLACEPCNKGIGMFGDDPARMRRAADNLEAANARVALLNAGKHVQDELPLNVTPLRREAG